MVSTAASCKFRATAFNRRWMGSGSGVMASRLIPSKLLRLIPFSYYVHTGFIYNLFYKAIFFIQQSRPLAFAENLWINFPSQDFLGWIKTGNDFSKIHVANNHQVDVAMCCLFTTRHRTKHK